MYQFELHSLRNNGIELKLRLQKFFGFRDSETIITNCFSKFEKFLPHSITMLKLFDCQTSNARVRPGKEFLPPYKLGSQNTPFRFGLNVELKVYLPLVIVK